MFSVVEIPIERLLYFKYLSTYLLMFIHVYFML